MPELPTVHKVADNCSAPVSNKWTAPLASRTPTGSFTSNESEVEESDETDSISSAQGLALVRHIQSEVSKIKIMAAMKTRLEAQVEAIKGTTQLLMKRIQLMKAQRERLVVNLQLGRPVAPRWGLETLGDLTLSDEEDGPMIKSEEEEVKLYEEDIDEDDVLVSPGQSDDKTQLTPAAHWRREQRNKRFGYDDATDETNEADEGAIQELEIVQSENPLSSKCSLTTNHNIARTLAATQLDPQSEGSQTRGADHSPTTSSSSALVVVHDNRKRKRSELDELEQDRPPLHMNAEISLARERGAHRRVKHRGCMGAADFF